MTNQLDVFCKHFVEISGFISCLNVGYVSYSSSSTNLSNEITPIS